jgi:acyl-CoA synthetase (AMP-forming)/AMP-acid ligase II
MNISTYFHDAVERFPDKIAIRDSQNSITFSELQQDVFKTVGYLKSCGIKPGDRIMVFVPMSIDLYRILLAIFQLGATAVFLDEWADRKRLSITCDLADCTGFIGTFKAAVLKFFVKELRHIPIKLNRQGKGKADDWIENVSNDDPALITFTTGSTGVPKAALRTHLFLSHQFKSLKELIQPESSDVCMTILPIFLFVNLGVGCTSVLAEYNQKKPDHMNPRKLIDQMKRSNVNRLVCSPYFLNQLAHYSIDTSSVVNLDTVFVGGAPVFPIDAEKYALAFPTTEVVIVYGSTEAEPISSIQAKELAHVDKLGGKGVDVGKVFSGSVVRILEIKDENLAELSEQHFSDLLLNDEVIGEIIVRGDHVLDRYYKNEEAFKANKIVVDGRLWHRTGDSGFMKNERLYLTGRCKQLIHLKGKLIAPFVVESQLLAIHGVTCGTIVDLDGKLILVIESKCEVGSEDFELFQYDEMRRIKKIPRDPRHHSKIDYDKLKVLLK